jgi:MFS family permease
LLFLATAGSATGTYLAAVALSVDIFDRTDSGKWVALLLVADFLPMVVIGLTLGPLVDRLSRRKLMILSDLTRAVTFAALPFVDRPEAIVVLAAVGGIATGFFRPAVWAGMPNLVKDDELEGATSLLATTENAAWMIGPVVAGGLLSISGPSLAYGVNAVSFVLSAALLARIPARALQSVDPLTRGHWQDVRDGLGLVLRSRPLRTVLVVWSIAGIASAGVNVGEVFLAKRSLDAGSIGFGVLVGATGVGLVLGSLLAASALGRFGMTRLYGGSLLVMAAGFGLAGAAPHIAVACVLAGIGATGNGAAIVCNQILVQRGAPDAMRGRALAVLMSVYYACLGTGMAIAGILTDVIGPRIVWGIAGGVYLVAALLAFGFTHRIRIDLETRLEAEGFPVNRTGVDRLQELIGEIDATRREEKERPEKVLPYIARRRARSGSS